MGTDVGRYDGGTPGIPGDITGDPERVIVIAAGSPGLQALTELQAANGRRGAPGPAVNEVRARAPA